jgi:hypothetical protein
MVQHFLQVAARPEKAQTMLVEIAKLEVEIGMSVEALLEVLLGFDTHFRMAAGSV